MIDDNNITITNALIEAHGLTEKEYSQILAILERTPTLTELGIFSAMWNEHCSYKSSRKWLKTLPVTGEYVIQGPGENAGVVDIGNGKCIIFKMESHNHPSYIDPYQGAATGMGGILRDIFTMGARPIAALNALRFGSPEHKQTRHFVNGVVAGISGYANAFGVPTIGGEVNFDKHYNGNILVNAFAAGIADKDKIFYSKAQGVGLPVVYLGARTGRDGIGGATMASAEFGGDATEIKRPTIQIGDPFTEKCLLEACLELMAAGAVIAIQDMGAAGLTCSSVEMAAKGNLGIELNLDLVPVREVNMSAYEMMLSESQERMLMILHPEKEQEAKKIFDKWGLDFAIIGKTTEDLLFRVWHKNIAVAQIPIKKLEEEAPEYDRPWQDPEKALPLSSASLNAIGTIPLDVALLQLLSSPDLCSRRWVYEQYDSLILGNSLICPGGDAGLIRVESDQDHGAALAFSSDVTPRYCYADPYEGSKQAVAECWRNLSACGAQPLAATDNLNFGNPEKPEIMGQFVLSIRGIGDACRALNFPIVSGNVSLYNETNGVAILPTPTIAGVGLIHDWTKAARIDRVKQGDILLLVGKKGEHLGQSIYLRDLLGLSEGTPPAVDLALEKRHGEFIRSQIEQGLVQACHDISDGGLMVALAEMLIKSKQGAVILINNDQDYNLSVYEQCFGEDQSRYLIAASAETLPAILENARLAQIEIHQLGVAQGLDLELKNYFTIPIATLTTSYESWFPAFMETL